MQYNFSQNSQEIIIQFEIQNPQQLIIELTETSIFLTISSTNPIISGTLYSSIIVEKSTKNFDQKTKIFQFKLFKSNLSNWPFVIIKEHPKGYLDPHSEFLLSKYYESQRVFDKSLKYLLSSYNKGHKQSTIKLAMLYSFEYTGFPIEKDINKAFIFWKKAAFLGSSNAQFIVGNCYQNGNGCKKNYSKAKKYYQLALDNGNISAAYDLGCLYTIGGFGLKKDINLAIKYLEKSANAANPEAMYNLAVLYITGEEIQIDSYKANKFFQKAKELKPEIKVDSFIERLIEGSQKNINNQNQNQNQIQIQNISLKKDHKNQQKIYQEKIYQEINLEKNQKEKNQEEKNQEEKNSNTKYYVIGAITVIVIGIMVYKMKKRK